jgi:hypothetical protein
MIVPTISSWMGKLSNKQYLPSVLSKNNTVFRKLKFNNARSIDKTLIITYKRRGVSDQSVVHLLKTILVPKKL